MNNKVKKRRRFKSVDAMVKALSTKKFYKEWMGQKVKKRKHRHRYDQTWYAKGQKLWAGDYACICGKVRPLNNKVEE